MSRNVQIVDQPAIRAAGVRHTGPYAGIPEAFASLGAIAGRAGLFGPGVLMLAVYHDDPATTSPGSLRSDAAVSLKPGADVPAELTAVDVPGGRYACMRHTGPYDTLPEAWSVLLRDWLPQSGHARRDGPSYEVYRNTPMDTAPENLITDIYTPIA